MSKERLVLVENISKTYDDHPVALDISFMLSPGEVLALLGPNGAGKTTTIKMILGLVTPTSGRASVMGYDMAVESQMRKGVRHVGAVLEGARNAYWRLSVLENLRYFGGLQGIPRKRIDEKADELLTMLDLQEQRDREVRKFSRGMQQKVAIANALMHDPEILLLDEPTLGLDVEASKLLENTIARLAQQGKAVLLTTHVMSLAERLSTRTFVINKGREVAHDLTQVLLRQFDTRTIVEIKLQELPVPELWEQVSHYFPSIVSKDRVLEWVEPEQRQIVSLYHMLDQAGCTVLSVIRREPTLEEVFISLTRRVHANGAHA